MKKTILTIGLLACLSSLWAQQLEQFMIKGKVIDTRTKEPLPGAVINFDQGKAVRIADNEGGFSIRLAPGTYELLTSFIGYTPQNTSIDLFSDKELLIDLSEEGISMEEVKVFSTGYQKLPKERATGSFVLVEEELVNRRISTNILERLEDVTPGLIFNRAGPGQDRISIRGRSTLFANAQPLIVVDNLPYDGPIESINPFDVESITVLRDAAAASIWGAKAGNGVIVITTKSGADLDGPRVSLLANTTWVESPDPFYSPIMSTPDFVDLEKFLFQRGFYNTFENSASRPVLTPAVETLIQLRDGQITQQEADGILNNLSNIDVRNDYRDLIYRESILQQYALNISGGSKNQKYFISTGWDNNREDLIHNANQRITLNFRHQLSLLKNKLSVESGLYMALTDSDAGNPGVEMLRYSGVRPLYPYARLQDASGNPMIVSRDYRSSFLESAEAAGLLDWRYRPLEEIELTEIKNSSVDIRANLNLRYRITEHISASAIYQYWQNDFKNDSHFPIETYFTRDIINQFTQLENGVLMRPVPLGGILNNTLRRGHSNHLRTQLDFNRTLGTNRSRIDAIAGWEIKSTQNTSNVWRNYGYNDQTALVTRVDYENFYKRFNNPAQQQRILFNNSLSEFNDRFISYFANASYTLKGKYIFSASGRRDASNLFGVKTNQKWVPLWSAGTAWIISEEDFYKSSWLPFLKLRASYGYNGNTDRNVSAYTTATIIGTSFLSGFPAANLGNIGNPDLQWEKIQIFNLALDLENRSGWLRGNLEFYLKNGIDLIGDSPFPPSSGVTQFRGNFASTNTKGADLAIYTRNIDKKIRWETDWLISFIKEEVTDFKVNASVINYLSQGAGANPFSMPFPMEGRPLFSVHSLHWGGLNPDNGNPRGFLDGELSENYASIISAYTPETMIYHGPARPTSFGALRNTLTYKNLSVSINMTYRFGHFYRMNSVRYTPILRGEMGHGDYANRWQNPGDESISQIPSRPDIGNLSRDDFHAYSESLVRKADNIRLQDVRISYTLRKQNIPTLPFRNAELFCYANNVGLLWKATDDVLDPEFRSMKPLSSMALGLRIDF
ncbi:TonB-linked outer membrane protein, SusC/RagA family [Aquiflexum balticum DSM 16537]|uniref:TonB-linked outer membrane protein, SusC/RagA family n=1 Tax=Aquiflexum balticum DSM 16537 TaxID=758820 RepID=A0A1W2H693_9BACT|nr:SusC/RagA family TonB-linked outer membrane protein [Aquiflexum balticum]SMD44445.1 TonB-linked outer membrane protein, SusC/RagA family [Aquiflexum balticum DSM 16537]